MDAKERAVIMLDTAAIGYATRLQACHTDGAEYLAEEYAGAKRHLHRSALEYAAACGAPDASAQAELIALRLFRDGVVALRGEIETRRLNPAAARAPLTDVALAIETIDALLMLHGKVPT